MFIIGDLFFRVCDLGFLIGYLDLCVFKFFFAVSYFLFAVINLFMSVFKLLFSICEFLTRILEFVRSIGIEAVVADQGALGKSLLHGRLRRVDHVIVSVRIDVFFLFESKINVGIYLEIKILGQDIVKVGNRAVADRGGSALVIEIKGRVGEAYDRKIGPCEMLKGVFGIVWREGDL